MKFPYFYWFTSFTSANAREPVKSNIFKYQYVHLTLSINYHYHYYLALRLPFQSCVMKALEVIKWMNNHSRALGLFRQEQLYTYNKILALILPVITRWTAHYLCLHWLLTVEKTLKSAWLKHSEIMIASAGAKNDDKAKAIAVEAIINSPEFWYHVKK